ncbi:putative protein TPRXL isoform X1 [Panicum virgatum]|nr:putative protein TPRXL isoform X1 [Panicum virgatum]KAG2540326.1 hypothetical protein PVAP13_9NG544900 [Panicum virgatum]
MVKTDYRDLYGLPLSHDVLHRSPSSPSDVVDSSKNDAGMDPSNISVTPDSGGSGSDDNGGSSMHTSSCRRRLMSSLPTGTQLATADGRGSGSSSSSSSSASPDLESHSLLIVSPVCSPAATDDDVLIMDGALVDNGPGSPSSTRRSISFIDNNGPSNRRSVSVNNLVLVSSVSQGAISVGSSGGSGGRRSGSSGQIPHREEPCVTQAQRNRHSEWDPITAAGNIREPVSPTSTRGRSSSTPSTTTEGRTSSTPSTSSTNRPSPSTSHATTGSGWLEPRTTPMLHPWWPSIQRNSTEGCSTSEGTRHLGSTSPTQMAPRCSCCSGRRRCHSRRGDPGSSLCRRPELPVMQPPLPPAPERAQTLPQPPAMEHPEMPPPPPQKPSAQTFRWPLTAEEAAAIEAVLYQPSARKRLPVFKEIRPDDDANQAPPPPAPPCP